MTLKTQHETSNFPSTQTMEQDENCQNPSLKHHPTIVGGWSNPFENLLVKIDHFPKWGENFFLKTWNHHRCFSKTPRCSGNSSCTCNMRSLKLSGDSAWCFSAFKASHIACWEKFDPRKATTSADKRNGPYGHPSIPQVIDLMVLDRKDHHSRRDLQSTIPTDYYSNGLWLHYIYIHT